MSRMKPVTRRASLAMLTGFVTLARSPYAAAEDERDKHPQPISIAVPDFSGDPVSDEASARDLTEIIIADLKASGRFVLVEPDRSVDENLDPIPQFGRWRGLHAESLVIGRIARQEDRRVKVEFRLWDVATGHQLVGAQYWLQPEDWRRVPHVIAEAILGRLIGRS